MKVREKWKKISAPAKYILLELTSTLGGNT